MPCISQNPPLCVQTAEKTRGRGREGRSRREGSFGSQSQPMTVGRGWNSEHPHSQGGVQVGANRGREERERERETETDRRRQVQRHIETER